MSVPAARRLERGMWHYLNAWINILRGDRFDAYQQIQTALAIATEVGSPDFDTLCRLAWTETLAVCGDSRRAASQLRRAREHRQPSENPLLNFIASLTTARVLLDSGGRDEVLASLKDALSIGHRHGFTCSLWWRPDAMAELCAMALAHDMEVDYVRHIIRTNRLTPVDSAMDLRSWPWSFQVFTLGKFRLVKEGTTQSLVGKGSRRPLELLKVLIALGGRDVRVEHLTDILWPNTDGDYAYGSFTSTLHRLRRLLEVDEAVTLQDGRLNLNAEYFWVDTWTIEKLFAATDRDAAAWLSFASVTAAAEHLLDLYRGAFLEDESKLSCHIVLREHLRGKMQRLLTKIARHAKESSHIEAASSFFERAIDADPLCEGFYRDLMLLYDALGRRTEALDVYGRCHTVLTSRLRASPSPETIAIYDKLSHEDSFS
jgi:two-component SAPR family response regulator